MVAKFKSKPITPALKSPMMTPFPNQLNKSQQVSKYGDPVYTEPAIVEQPESGSISTKKHPSSLDREIKDLYTELFLLKHETEREFDVKDDFREIVRDLKHKIDNKQIQCKHLEFEI